MQTLFDIPAVKQFETFDSENPKVWELFEKYAKQLIDKGVNHWSADNILHKIRFETRLETNDPNYKINNNYSAFYARKFARIYPKHKDFFEFRKSKAD